MEVRATGKYIRVQPRKVRIIATEVKGKTAAQAANVLAFHTSKGARELRKVLVSAMANAYANNNIPYEQQKIRVIQVDEGPRLKRMTQKSMGRGARIIKKTSHITVIVEDFEPTAKVKPHGTKAKPRPTLAAKPAKKKGGAAKAEAAPVAAPVEEAAAVEEVVTDAPSVETEAQASEEKGEE